LELETSSGEPLFLKIGTTFRETPTAKDLLIRKEIGSEIS